MNNFSRNFSYFDCWLQRKFGVDSTEVNKGKKLKNANIDVVGGIFCKNRLIVPVKHKNIREMSRSMSWKFEGRRCQYGCGCDCGCLEWNVKWSASRYCVHIRFALTAFRDLYAPLCLSLCKYSSLATRLSHLQSSKWIERANEIKTYSPSGEIYCLL